MQVAIETVDSITHAGLVSYCRSHGLAVVTGARRSEADVVVLAPGRLDQQGITWLREITNAIGAPVILLINEIDESELLTAVECKVVAVLPRSAVVDKSLARHIRETAARGEVLEGDLLGRLIEHVQRLQREILDKSAPNTAVLSGRETDVLRLMADGWATDEIARKLCYSERTVKNVISTITNRLHLRNRPNAVAYALRAGII